MINAPIWKDTRYTGATDWLYFKVEDSTGTTVYNGTAEPYPGQSGVSIYVNRLVADFLNAEINPTRDGVQSDPEACQQFTLKNESGTTLETYKFLLSSAGDFTGSDKVLSCPVNGHMDPRMRVVYSRYSSASRTITMKTD